LTAALQHAPREWAEGAEVDANIAEVVATASRIGLQTPNEGLVPSGWGRAWQRRLVQRFQGGGSRTMAKGQSAQHVVPNGNRHPSDQAGKDNHATTIVGEARGMTFSK
jgi:hypothetical protein